MKLESVVASVLGVSQQSLQENSDFKSMSAWDSMTHIELITRIERDFRVEFTGDEIADMKTFGDVRRFLRARGIQT